MAEMACRISSIVSATIDLSTLVATAFIDCEVLSFQMKDTVLDDLFDINTKALSAYEIIRTLKTKFQYLKAQGLWSPSEGKKLDMYDELYILKMVMNKLVESQKRGQIGGHGRSQDGKAWGLSGISCF